MTRPILMLIALTLLTAACGIKRPLRMPESESDPTNMQKNYTREQPKIDEFIAPPNEPPSPNRRGMIVQ